MAIGPFTLRLDRLAAISIAETLSAATRAVGSDLRRQGLGSATPPA